MLKFYICRTCGNLIEMIEDSKNIPICCGRPMSRLEAASTDGVAEKHVPVITVDECPNCTAVTVQVGKLIHPMENFHHIDWIEIETDCGTYRRNINVGDDPVETFYLSSDETVIAVYAYCNLHGLWVN